jgi:hypothetical protein
VRGIVLVAIIALPLIGCPEPSDRPDVPCADACKVQLSTVCKPRECARGCAFVLDRLVEHQQATVLDCMKSQKACDDAMWAGCAARVGPHVDGGPGVAPASTAQEP